MELRIPRLSQARRAGLLAAVSVYPISRLAGTLRRPALDQAVVSGVTMTVAYYAASTSTSVARRVAQSEQHPARAGLGAAALAAAGAVVAAGVARHMRHRATELAREGSRLDVAPAAVGSGAEIAVVGLGASSLVALAEGLTAKLPEGLKPEHPRSVTIGITVAAAALATAARDNRVAAYLTIDPDDPDDAAHFLPYEKLPVALGRSVAVAGVAIGVLLAENKGALAIARGVSRSDDPGWLARATGHAAIGTGVAFAALGGFAFYSSRVAVQERILESAYAAVPSRTGVSGGLGSHYEFGDLGREGRRFVSQAYTADEITGVTGVPAVDPVRAFLPLHGLTGDPVADADQLVDELESLGAFDKSVIVLAAPTGDGYVSYVFAESVELLTGGDCAIAVVPYAEVPSAVALPRRKRAGVAHRFYARAVAERAAVRNPSARLFVFGESLGSIVGLDAYGPDVVKEMTSVGYSGGLFLGVPILSTTDRAIRPRDPQHLESHGVQYCSTREQALAARPGFVVVTHLTDPTAVGDASTLVRHSVDWFKRPIGAHVPVVSFLANLADVKNAMNLRPGNFEPSPGHDYRYETAAAVSRAFDLPFDLEDDVEKALRDRELAWSVRRLLSRQIGDAREAVNSRLQGWGIDPSSLATRFATKDGEVPAWLQGFVPETQVHS